MREAHRLAQSKDPIPPRNRHMPRKEFPRVRSYTTKYFAPG
jgi:hypothetical protein